MYKVGDIVKIRSFEDCYIEGMACGLEKRLDLKQRTNRFVGISKKEIDGIQDVALKITDVYHDTNEHLYIYSFKKQFQAVYDFMVVPFNKYLVKIK